MTDGSFCENNRMVHEFVVTKWKVVKSTDYETKTAKEVMCCRCYTKKDLEKDQLAKDRQNFIVVRELLLSTL